MIELSKHIEILLLENDCVIVPGFGGFITHYQPAHYEEAEGVFIPPARMVGFNSQLTMNDGLLVQSYMQVYHMDYPDALKKIGEEVEQLTETLHKEGVAEMPGIGILHYTIYGTYEFLPEEKGVLSPALYALDSFSIAPLSLEAIEEPVHLKEPSADAVVAKKERKEFHLNTKWLGNAVAVAVAAILFFVLSVPVENTYIENGNYASLGTDGLFDAIRSQSVATTLMTNDVVEKPQTKPVQKTVSAPIVVKVEKVAPAPEVKEAPKADVVKKEVSQPKKAVEKTTPKQETKKAVAQKKKYHLIVASLTTEQDAQRMLKTYQNEGHREAKVIGGNGRFRIALYSYADQKVAYGKLNELKQQDAFKSAWMLTSK